MIRIMARILAVLCLAAAPFVSAACSSPPERTEITTTTTELDRSGPKMKVETDVPQPPVETPGQP